MSSAVSQSRGDLGFIPNSIAQHNSRMFGMTSNPSKKGVQLRARSAVETMERPLQEMTSDAIIGKRTEWLEGQERKLTATLNEQRTEQQHLAQQVAKSTGTMDDLHKETMRLSSEAKKQTIMTQQLYEETQWVFGKTSVKLMGVPLTKEPHKVLEQYRQRQGEIDKEVLADKNEWALLCYPMVRVETLSGHQALMRMKRVDPETGQLSMAWAIVYENYEGSDYRAIERFSFFGASYLPMTA